MAIYWAGAGLLRKRAGLLAVLALGTTPLFVLEARQLTSDAPLLAGLALALGALGRYAWPADGRRRVRDLVLGALGLAVGLLAGGAMSGVVLPLLALTLALAIGDGLIPVAAAGVADGTARWPRRASVPTSTAERSFGASTWRLGARGFFAFALLAVAATVLLVVGLGHVVAGKYSWLVGAFRTPARPHTASRRWCASWGSASSPGAPWRCSRWPGPSSVSTPMARVSTPMARVSTPTAPSPAPRGPTRAWPSSSSTCSSSPAWATRCRAIATSCSGRRATRRSPPSRWRSALFSTRRWRDYAPSRSPVC